MTVTSEKHTPILQQAARVVSKPQPVVLHGAAGRDEVEEATERPTGNCRKRNQGIQNRV